MDVDEKQQVHIPSEHEESKAARNVVTTPREAQETLPHAEFYQLEEHTEILDAIFTVFASNICLYDPIGQLLQAHSAVREFLGLDMLPGYETRSLRERAVQFFLRGPDGTLLVEEEWPVRRLLNGEVLRSTDAVDVLVRKADGRDVLINICGAPIRDAAGHIAGAIAICNDVTERRKIEQRTQKALDALLAMAEALMQETHKLASAETEVADMVESAIGRRLVELPCRLLECQRVGIALLEPDSEILHPMVVVGISHEHEQLWWHGLQGARLSNFLDDPVLTFRLRAGDVLVSDAAQSFLRDQPSYKLISPILKGSQLIGILLLDYGSVKPHLSANEFAIVKTIARLASVVIEREKAQKERDQAVAALQSANEELAHMNRVKSDLISVVSHEFHTALTGIQGFSEMIRDKNLKIVEMKEFAADIYSDARRLARKINDLVDLDLMESKRSELNLGWLDLNAIIIDISGQAHASSPEHLFRLHLANALPVLMGDHERLTTVVLNLFNNAIRYSPGGGEIFVSSVVEGNVVHVSVRDHGVGISANELERIFERYAHVGSETTRDESELDLPLVREIVELHGGQAWAESIPGKGSIFHFTVQFTAPTYKGENDGKDSAL